MRPGGESCGSGRQRLTPATWPGWHCFPTHRQCGLITKRQKVASVTIGSFSIPGYPQKGILWVRTRVCIYETGLF